MKRCQFSIVVLIAGILMSGPVQAELRDWKSEYQRGLDAARSGDFETAVSKLGLVFSETKTNPGVIFNLGLANAQEGNFIKAGMLFRLYLVMVPNAANAEAVKTEIGRLDQKIAAGELELFKRAIAAATEFPDIAPEDDYSKPKKTELFNDIARRAEEVGNREIADEALALAFKAAATVGYEFEPSDVSDLFRNNLDDVGDIVAIVDAQEGFDDPEDYLDRLMEAIDKLSGIWPEKASTYLQILPREAFAIESYTTTNLVKLGVSTGIEDSFFARRAWDKELLYLKEVELRDAVLNYHPSSEWEKLARRILRRKPESLYALASLSQSRKALKIILANGGNPFNPYGEWSNSVMVARVSLSVGNNDGISRARKQLLKLSKGESDFSKMTDLLRHTVSGNMNAALKPLGDRDTEWDFWEQNMDHHYSRSAETAAHYLMDKGDLDQAREMISKGVRAFEVPDMLRRLANQYELEGNTDTADELRTEANQKELDVQGGWKPRSPDHMDRINRWKKAYQSYRLGSGNTQSVDYAAKQALNTEYCSSDTDAECIIDSLFYAAKAWGNVRLTIRTLEKLDPESSIWLDQAERQALIAERDDALQRLPSSVKLAFLSWKEEELDDDEKRALAINTHRIAADADNTNAVIALIDLYAADQKGLSESEVASLVGDGLRRRDQDLYEHVQNNFKSWDKELRKEFQRVLADEGHYTSGIDGIIGPGTRKAIDAMFVDKTSAQ
jgi:tetratricopeptide (TPR) repeat protein